MMGIIMNEVGIIMNEVDNLAVLGLHKVETKSVYVCCPPKVLPAYPIDEMDTPPDTGTSSGQCIACQRGLFHAAEALESNSLRE